MNTPRVLVTLMTATFALARLDFFFNLELSKLFLSNLELNFEELLLKNFRRKVGELSACKLFR